MNNETKPDQQTKDAWQQDPNNWKWGIFYFNKEDKRIFPPKRSNMGWTTNFANPLSVAAIIAVGIILTGLIVLVKNTTNK